MIKNIYDKRNKYYNHEYFCDNCFSKIEFGEILRNDLAIKVNLFDLCSKCEREFYRKELVWIQKNSKNYKKS